MFRRLLTCIRNPESTPAWGLPSGLLLLGAAFAAIIIGSTIGSLLFPQAQFILLSGWTIAAFITIAITLLNLSKPDQRAALQLTQSGTFPGMLLLMFVGVGLAVTLDVILRAVTGAALPAPELMDIYFRAQFFQQPVQPVSWMLALVFMAALQPLAEELIFRGVLLPVLRSAIGSWPGYLVNALLYAAFHMLLYPPPLPNTAVAAWYGFIAPLAAGLIFGAVRLYSGSTRAAVLTHAAFGLFAVINWLSLTSRG